MNVPYIPGTDSSPDFPLGRFLPPIPAGMISEWCRQNLALGNWVLEPFGFNPLIPIEIAKAGHPILVAANNPIHAFLIRVLASAPQKGELTAALQDLAIAPKGDGRMEPFIRSLYAVKCQDCGRHIDADAFLWHKNEEQPYAVIISCPYCGATGEQSLTPNALDSLTPLPPVQMHMARALNRIADRDDPLRLQVENALNAYLPRPILVLQTIINKLESLRQTPRRRQLLIALILSAADRGNTLWAHPTPRERPRQIVIPSTFKEVNLWKALEDAIQTWQFLDSPVPVWDWDGTFNISTGIVVYQDRVKELLPSLQDVPIKAVVTTIPRPNQAFWTLSALWTGWIWGQTAVTPIRQLLARQRYDWNWHAHALSVVFHSLQDLIQPEGHFCGLIAENEPSFLLAALIGANIAGYRLHSFANSRDDKIAQCIWKPEIKVSNLPEDRLRLDADHKLKSFLQEKGEPASYQQLHTALVAGLAHDCQLAIPVFTENKRQMTSDIQRWLDDILLSSAYLYRIPDKTTSLETGRWWLRDPSAAMTPLIDRIEALVIQHLIEADTTTSENLKTDIYSKFPGLFTPDNRVLFNCLESYGDLIDQERHHWQLRPSEKPAARAADIKMIREQLCQIGQRLGYHILDQDPLLWREAGDTTLKYRFHILSTALLAAHFQEEHTGSTRSIFVVPGSRANLLAYKSQRNPVFAEHLEQNYLVLKFRLVRDLQANPLLTRELFEKQIHVDPPEYRASQLALF